MDDAVLYNTIAGSQNPTPVLAPPGEYDFVIKEVSYEQSKKGNNMYKVQAKLVSPGCEQYRDIISYITFPDPQNPKPFLAFQLRAFFESIAWNFAPSEKGGMGVPRDTNALLPLIGLRGRAFVKVEENEGYSPKNGMDWTRGREQPAPANTPNLNNPQPPPHSHQPPPVAVPPPPPPQQAAQVPPPPPTAPPPAPQAPPPPQAQPAPPTQPQYQPPPGSQPQYQQPPPQAAYPVANSPAQAVQGYVDDDEEVPF